MTFDGPVLQFDFPGLLVGVAEYEEGPTGLTVFCFDRGVLGTVDVRGGGAATINTDRLRHGHEHPTVRAVFFAGGSSYGLEAASGIMAELCALRGGCPTWDTVPTVTGAVVFDFRSRDNAVHPDKNLGRAAMRSAKSGLYPLGAHGAGRFVHVGKLFGPRYMERAGQGGAFRQIGATRLAVFTVVNSVGVLVDRTGNVVRGNFDADAHVRTTFAADLNSGAAAKKRLFAKEDPDLGLDMPPGGNTTLTLLVTNEVLTYPQLNRLAVQTHTAMARCIQPFHTQRDGDVLFAVTTGEQGGASIDFEELAIHAAELAWDSVLSSITFLKEADAD
jgi:L-aminopeptidase/D-esterase-like protein